MALGRRITRKHRRRIPVDEGNPGQMATPIDQLIRDGREYVFHVSVGDDRGDIEACVRRDEDGVAVMELRRGDSIEKVPLESKDEVYDFQATLERAVDRFRHEGKV